MVSPATVSREVDADALSVLADHRLFAPYSSALRALACSGAWQPQSLELGLRPLHPDWCANFDGKPIRFVAPDGESLAYEPRVRERGEVLTRPGNWHDLFNALVWLAFPRTKAALNAVHLDEIASRGGGGRRGALRDAATQFDESGLVVLSADAELLNLLKEQRWVDLFWHRRADVVRSMRFLVFGHGLCDALRAPFPGLCGRCALVEVERSTVDALVDAQARHADDVLARRFLQRDWYSRPKAFVPLPVLGIPGLDPLNESMAYYEDARQFRPLRASDRMARAPTR